MSDWLVEFEDGQKISGNVKDLLCLRDLFIFSADLKSRISKLFLLELYIMNKRFDIEPYEILESVFELERGENTAGIKPAAPFRHKPLKGLWHKHFFASRFLPHNIVLGLGKHGLREIVEEELLPHVGEKITEEMIGKIARRTTTEPIEKRSDNNGLTGEWIIFLPWKGKNYYLSIAAHSFGDQRIFDRVITETKSDFPEIEKWISEVAAE